MLSRKYSIKKQNFYKIYKYGRTINVSNFVIKIHPNLKNYSQYAVVISKKIISKATGRNRIRRIIKSWILEILDYLPKGRFIVITLKKNILNIENLDLIKNDLTRCLKSLR